MKKHIILPALFVLICTGAFAEPTPGGTYTIEGV